MRILCANFIFALAWCLLLAVPAYAQERDPAYELKNREVDFPETGIKVLLPPGGEVRSDPRLERERGAIASYDLSVEYGRVTIGHIEATTRDSVKSQYDKFLQSGEVPQGDGDGPESPQQFEDMRRNFLEESTEGYIEEYVTFGDVRYGLHLESYGGEQVVCVGSTFLDSVRVQIVLYEYLDSAFTSFSNLAAKLLTYRWKETHPPRPPKRGADGKLKMGHGESGYNGPGVYGEVAKIDIIMIRPDILDLLSRIRISKNE